MAGRKPKAAGAGRSDFAALLADVKGRIQVARTRAVLAVNGELVHLYWDIGRIIVDRQRRERLGAAVIPRLALKLKNKLPDLKGFSERNIDRMIAFYRGYPVLSDFSPPAVAKLAGRRRSCGGRRAGGRHHSVSFTFGMVTTSRWTSCWSRDTRLSPGSK